MEAAYQTAIPRRRYFVVPGYVTSVNDGDIHWISGNQLMDLYGVNPSECVVASRRTEGMHIGHLIKLYPQDYAFQYRHKCHRARRLARILDTIDRIGFLSQKQRYEVIMQWQSKGMRQIHNYESPFRSMLRAGRRLTVVRAEDWPTGLELKGQVLNAPKEGQT